MIATLLLHVPAMAGPVASALVRTGREGIVDATVGAGGHAALLLERLGPDGRVLGLDRDERALELAQERIGGDARATLRRSRLRDLATTLDAAGWTGADGILLDLGVSSMQLDDAGRGFSFAHEGPLDLRMSPAEGGPTAADLVNRLPEKQLADVLYELGEERASRRVARAIVDARRRARIERTTELAEIVRRAVPFSRADARRIHPATRTFQALRIAVNGELEELELGLDQALARLRPGGRIAVLAYHSLEDRIVKTRLRRAQEEGFRLVTRRPLRPDDVEVAENPRARSARLRVAEKEAA
ncbi:MAG TPA: 16S rRNA (cytosine(1402)-N(4))-methyltransferase RsmH [Planctomycetota bacterium]|nr:16S rRNA (cytosine(1402)-N(4))-methyltransferase RsmH [Planctomycetota bacterium]